MKKSSIVLAMLAAAGGACAQSSLTLSGAVDAAFVYGRATGAGSGSAKQMNSSDLSTSKLVIRGNEDLGNGLSASFWLEAQLFTDDGRAGNALSTDNQTSGGTPGGLNFSRRSTVSLTGPWGEVRLGRDVTPSHLNILEFDPYMLVGLGGSVVLASISQGLGAGPQTFGLVPAGTAGTGPWARASNMVTYVLPSPKTGGIFARAAYWLGENPQNGTTKEDDGSGGALRLGYENERFKAAVGWGRTAYKATPVATTAGAPSGALVSRNVGAEWKFGGGTRLMGMYTAETRASAVPAEGRGWLVGAILPVNAEVFRASLSQYRIDGGAGADPRARKLALQWSHHLSKRTAVYTTAARVWNSNGARISLVGSTIGAGVTDSVSTGISFGIRHLF